jgi:glycosyltransferase involved in cell wall biosynthesis
MRITVITPTFNSERTIGRCIKSVQSQTYPCEHIIIDALSSDATSSIIAKYNRNGDKLISESDAGIYDAINKGIKYASGDIIAVLNSDDYYLNNDVLKLVADGFKDDTELLYAGTRYFTNVSQSYVDYLPSEFSGYGSFVSGWHPPHPSFFVLKRCYVTGGGYDTNLKVAADFDLMLRFFETLKFRAKRMDKVLVGMSPGGFSSKLSSIFKGMLEIRRSFLKNSQSVSVYYFLNRYMRKFIQRKLSFLSKFHES